MRNLPAGYGLPLNLIDHSDFVPAQQLSGVERVRVIRVLGFECVGSFLAAPIRDDAG